MSITPFGLQGPRAHWRANDLVALAVGGLLALNGFPDRPPWRPSLHRAYHLAGATAAAGALLALLERARSGRGQLVEVALQAAVATTRENAVGYWDVRGEVRKRLEDKMFTGLQSGYRCRDGWVVGVPGGRWDEVRRWASDVRPADARYHDPRLADRAYREAHPELVGALMADLFGRDHAG
ncbi:MAG: CoA transferase [Chloroflexi bacterium]|nr:CoA transferase [Chloroflexota bacterium]